jgi:maltooligosyltrehalose trehalohydrolase
VEAVLLDRAGQTTAAVELEREEHGYFAGFAEAAATGTLYKFRLDGGDSFPDPASRFQPEGPHGPSQVVDPMAFEWSDGSWPGVHLPGQVIYELHVGTFTVEGTYAAAAKKLPLLKQAGVTVVELMPLADFPGQFGWGYDGVSLFAPTRLYGTPDDLRRLIDTAHGLGLGVAHDVVYNHLGPSGNYLGQYSPDYFTRHKTEWGDALNFDGENSHGLREFFLSNAGYWVREFHFDGLRLDAVHAIRDQSGSHFLEELAQQVPPAAGGRKTFVVAEHERQETRMLRPLDAGGYGIDGLWNDDLHHSAAVALTGRKEAYFQDFSGTPQEFLSAAKYGTLYQGQRHSFSGERRGESALGLPPWAFVNFLENHDQVANSGHGRRLHQLTSPGRLRAMTAYLLLTPGTPMLFQGQEFASSHPFLYFADHEPGLCDAVRKGRKEFLAQSPSLGTPEMQRRLDDPGARETFERCRLDWQERESGHGRRMLALHRDLLELRRNDAAFREQQYGRLDGAVLGERAFALRYFVDGGEDRLLAINLGVDLHLFTAPEPLLAPPEGKCWRVLWSSEDPRYGGSGTPHPETEEKWIFTGESALLLGT